jgi:molecular chaperone DnaK
VARGGVFIATRAIKPEGTPIAFEFVLEDGTRLMRGEGIVQKTQIDEGGTRAGMTVRFVRLDARTKALVDRVIAHRSGIPLGAAVVPPAFGESEAPSGLKRKLSAESPAGKTGSFEAGTGAPARGAGAPVEKTGSFEAGTGAPAGKTASFETGTGTPAGKTGSFEVGTGAPARRTGPVEVGVVRGTEVPSLDESAPDLASAAASAAAQLERGTPGGEVASPQSPSAGAPSLQSEVQRPASPVASSSEASARRTGPLEVPRDPGTPVPPSRAAEAKPAPRRRSLPEIPIPPVARATEELVLGIDLGTTNSRVAVVIDGTAHLLAVGGPKSYAIPSVVAIDDKGRTLVGARAKANVLVDPRNTVYGAKRLLGRRARSAKIRELAMRFPYTLVADPEGDTGVELRGQVYRLTDISALLLKELKAAAQELLGRELHKAVLCVPAYFNDHQREAMMVAGRAAGLEVLRVLNEPSSVALAFGYGRGLARKRILVYDLGGGTFDASVVELTGDDLEVVTTGGDNFLGGLDFDTRLTEQLSLALGEEGRARLKQDLLSAQRVRDAAEQAKITLSDQEIAKVRVPFAIIRDDGSPVDLDAEVTRAMLEEVTSDLVERTIEVTQAVLDASNVKPQSLDEVLLVGGQSRAPLVRRRLEEALGKGVRTDVDPHAAVAMGAAILGHALLQRERGKEGVSLSEVLSAPIGIGVRGGKMKRVLEKNTRLPAEKTISFPVKEAEAVGIAVFQGLSGVAEENEYLGSLHAVLEKAGELTLRFAVSPDGKLDLSAVSSAGRKAEVTLSTADASDEVRAALFAQSPLPGEEPVGPPPGLLSGIRKLFGRS